MKTDKCDLLQVDLDDIEVLDKLSLETPVKLIVLHIIEALDGSYDPYLAEMAPYFQQQIRAQYAFDVCDKHWFRMAGSLVWLEEYGVHMMVSRLAYSPDGSRNNPKLSFVYTELFDSRWQPVEMSLVVPTNIDNYRHFVHNSQHYAIVNYPTILPVPFFHDSERGQSKYLGPEDARVILVKNAAGHEEPLLIFNAYHHKLEAVDDDEDDYNIEKMQEYRSMWISWPWQYQVGKANVAGVGDSRYDKQIYNKAKELAIKNTHRQANQKNWTPMKSQSLRAIHGYDKELLFVYRWANLQVLKCDISNDDRCGFVFNSNERLISSSIIGPLRGGTLLVNLNDLLDTTQNDLAKQLIPKDREIWVGFARAHMLECGCGKDLYRPNLVVMVKDVIMKDGMPKEIFKLGYVSDFMSLNVDIILWNPFKPYELCKGTNALIPNGISKWDIEIGKTDETELRIDDEVCLTISISDSTIDAVWMKGLLKALIAVPDNSLFLTSSNELDEVTKKRLRLPQSSDSDLGDLGYNNDNLVCAMQASKKFCGKYGKEREKIESQFKGRKADDDLLIQDPLMERYRAVLDELGLGLE